jgi:hypothetical protein
MERYHAGREVFLQAATKSQGDDLVRHGGSFSDLCNTLADQVGAHLSIPSANDTLEHPLQKAHDVWGNQIRDTLRAAGRVAVDFAALDLPGSTSLAR